MKYLLLSILAFGLLLTACSNNSSSSKSASNDAGASMEKSSEANMNMVSSNQVATEESAVKAERPEAQTDRKVIYKANLRLEVESFADSQLKLERHVEELGGYIVQSEIYNRGEERVEGTLTIRVPQEHFQPFLQQAEDWSRKVEHRSVTGQDVTEEYVDLESRLETKRLVEQRLLTFMNDAQETKDLLQISKDLETVQGEMEKIKGRINFLDNQTDLATITITMIENKIAVPGVVKGELNTWDHVKKEFMDSINFILSALSALIVFLIGNSPLFLITLFIIGIIFYIRKKIKSKE